MKSSAEGVFPCAFADPSCRCCWTPLGVRCQAERGHSLLSPLPPPKGKGSWQGDRTKGAQPCSLGCKHGLGELIQQKGLSPPCQTLPGGWCWARWVHALSPHPPNPLEARATSKVELRDPSLALWAAGRGEKPSRGGFPSLCGTDPSWGPILGRCIPLSPQLLRGKGSWQGGEGAASIPAQLKGLWR